MRNGGVRGAEGGGDFNLLRSPPQPTAASQLNSMEKPHYQRCLQRRGIDLRPRGAAVQCQIMRLWSALADAGYLHLRDKVAVGNSN